MNNIQIFNNPEFGNVRVVGDSDDPLFCLADVCGILGLTPKGVNQRLAKDVISNYPLETAGGTQQALFVNEDGLYDVILDSRKPEAKQFRKWVTSEILPSIRKHGAYLTNETIEKAITSPDFLIKIATELKAEKQRRAELEYLAATQEKVITGSAPKVQYYEKVLNSESTYVTNQIAKELGMSAETLNKKLQEKGIQYKQNGTWLLTCKYQNKGFTKTHTHLFTRLDGSQGTSMLTVWTEKGREFIHTLF